MRHDPIGVACQGFENPVLERGQTNFLTVASARNAARQVDADVAQFEQAFRMLAAGPGCGDAAGIGR